jgi:hypothetical protein
MCGHPGLMIHCWDYVPYDERRDWPVCELDVKSPNTKQRNCDLDCTSPELCFDGILPSVRAELGCDKCDKRKQ